MLMSCIPRVLNSAMLSSCASRIKAVPDSFLETNDGALHCAGWPPIRCNFQWLRFAQDQVDNKPSACWRHRYTIPIVAAIEIEVGESRVPIDDRYVVRRPGTQPRPMGHQGL